MKRHALVLILFAVALLSCATTGPGGRQSLVLIPTSQEIAIGAGMATEVESTETVLDDPVWQDYITEIGEKIVAVCDRRDIEYRFRVIESDQVNAFAAPGGFIYFYTGLLKEMDDESELAAVVAHEISHVVARHSMKRIQAALGVALAYQLAFGDEGAGEALDLAVNLGMSLAFSSYSRENEREADRYGIHYMTLAGYDPHGALGMFDKLAALGGGGTQNIFEQLASSHPDTQERIANATAQLAEMGQVTGATDAVRYQEMLARLK